MPSASEARAAPGPRVLQVVWNLIRGGTEGQCARAALALTRRGESQRVAVFRREGFFLPEVETACGPVHVVDIHRMAQVRTVRAVRRLCRFIRDENVNVVHAWDPDAAIFGSWAACRAGVPWITSRRDLGEIYRGFKLRLMRWADRGAQAVVVNARANAAVAAARHIPPARLVLIPNMLDVTEFDERARRLLPFQLPEGRMIVLVARLDPEKDAATFVHAAREIAAGVPDVRFVIAGDGRERPALERLARELGMDGRVVFLGDITEVPGLLRRAYAGVLVPNRNEGLSNTILEYMAAGLPVVATTCGGNAELVEEGRTGHLVPVGDVPAVVRALRSLLDDPAQAAALGRAGRARVERDHATPVIAEQLAALYRRVWEGARHG